MNRKQIFSAVMTGALFTLMGMSAQAALPGWYTGLQLGYGNTHYGAGDITNGFPVTSANVTNSGLAGRLYAGYQLNQNWAGEIGYSLFSSAKFNNINAIPGLDGSIHQYALDLMGKGIIPINDAFNFYGKLGAAYVKASTSGVLTGNPSAVYPAFALGLSYDINPNVPVDIAWTRIQQVGSGAIQSVDMLTLGIAYNFG